MYFRHLNSSEPSSVSICRRTNLCRLSSRELLHWGCLVDLSISVRTFSKFYCSEQSQAHLSSAACFPFTGMFFLKVLLPIRRGLMFQTASASSRVQAKNGIITQGIEIMSLMCKAYESLTTPTEISSQKVKGGGGAPYGAQKEAEHLQGCTSKTPLARLFPLCCKRRAQPVVKAETLIEPKGGFDPIQLVLACSYVRPTCFRLARVFTQEK